MNTAKPYLVLVVLTLLLAACTSGAEPFTSPLASTSPLSPVATPNTLGALVITYERDGGIAGFHDVWRIYADGGVEAVSGNKPAAQMRLPADTIATAVRQIADSGFFALADAYMPADTCCDRYTYKLTVFDGGVAKTVITMDGAEQPSALADALTTVGKLIQQASQAQ
jgi:hypothetical protein